MMKAGAKCEEMIRDYKIPLTERELCRLFYRRGHTHGRIHATSEGAEALREAVVRLEIELKRIRRQLENGK